MLRIRATGPLILASLLKQPCCQAFALLTSIGSRVTAPDSLDRTYCSRSSAVPPGWRATMPPKRGHWQRKKEERSRSFAKRGRIGGWGDYGADGPRKSEVGSQTGGKLQIIRITSVAPVYLVMYSNSSRNAHVSSGARPPDAYATACFCRSSVRHYDVALVHVMHRNTSMCRSIVFIGVFDTAAVHYWCTTSGPMPLPPYNYAAHSDHHFLYHMIREVYGYG